MKVLHWEGNACKGCPYCYGGYLSYECHLSDLDIDDSSTIPDWCELPDEAELLEELEKRQ